jgi:phospholipase/carboxylesterase
MADLALPVRSGPPPETTQPAPGQRDPATFVHRQLTQTAPPRLQEDLFRRICDLPGVSTADSRISVPGARGFFLADGAGPPDAFMVGTEFAHLHPPADGSLHVGLPPDVYGAVRSAGWGVPHPLVHTMLLYGPRTPDELSVVWRVFLAAYAYASGEP